MRPISRDWKRFRPLRIRAEGLHELRDQSGLGDPSGVLTRETVRAYKRAASRLREVLEGSPEGLAISFKLKAARGQPTSGSFHAGDRVHRHAALLRPFMASNSPIELRRVWQQLARSGVHERVRTQIEDAFERADHLSMGLQLNDKALSARDVYYSFGEGGYFSDNPDAKKLVGGLNVGPMAPLLEMLFHEACAGYTNLVFVLLDALLAWERLHPHGHTEAATGPCIYCRTEKGDFGPEEHVIPESLGGDELVLVGAVCSACNNRLSRLDQVVLDFEPIALLRALYGPLTKKGKFPRARLSDFDLERTAPRAVRMTQKSGRALSTPEPEPDGSVRFSVTGRGRRPFDPVPLARGLFKIGLGLVAHHAGTSVALEPRYDAARRFVLDAEPIDTHLVLTRVGKPHPQLRTWVEPAQAGTCVVLDIFGVAFAFNLEPVPLPQPLVGNDIVQAYWLGSSISAPETKA